MKIIQNDDNTTFYIGENAKDNFNILSQAKQNDLWFHLSKCSSPFVILHGKQNKTNINYAALLCKMNSKYKHMKNISIDYLPVKYVKKSIPVGTVELKKKPKIIKC